MKNAENTEGGDEAPAQHKCTTLGCTHAVRHEGSRCPKCRAVNRQDGKQTLHKPSARCPDCGGAVWVAGKRCRKCAGLARRKSGASRQAAKTPRTEPQENPALPRGVALYLARKLLDDPATEVVAGDVTDVRAITLTLHGYLP